MMKLFREIIEALRWLMRLGRVFFRQRPWTTMVTVGSAALERVLGILAFVLPLKVIFLVASTEWPGALGALAESWGRTPIVVGLAGIAVGCFIMSVVLDFVVNRLTASAKVSVLRGDEARAVIARPGEQARATYAQFVKVASGMLFVGVGLVFIATLDPLLFSVLMACVVVLVSATALVMRDDASRIASKCGRLIADNFKEFLEISKTIIFLTAFAAVLIPFVVGDGGDVVSALLCIIVLRRMLGVAVQAVSTTRDLVRRRMTIDPLLFSGYRYFEPAAASSQSLRDAFSRKERQQCVEQALQKAGYERTGVIEVCWQDSSLAGIALLDVKLESAESESAEEHVQVQIYPRGQRHRLANEDLLFSHIARQELKAPALIGRFTHRGFRCQLCRVGAGFRMDGVNWNDLRWKLQKAVMSVEPPCGLVQAFAASTPMLGERLFDGAINSLAAGIDSNEEQKLLDELGAMRASLRALLDGLPFYIFNPEIQRSNIIGVTEQQYAIMTWGNWKIEPLGAGLEDGADGEKIPELVDHLIQSRSDCAGSLSSGAMELSRQAWLLERDIRQDRLKSGLARVRAILENPMLAEPAAGESPRAHGVSV